mmetsp:Transcript_7514/g.24009  ORF Transcript_7514/g.24009 Transcript_7514/m.24009 type:complete len:279 (+) Transcript_7514:522-1358(+)
MAHPKRAGGDLTRVMETAQRDLGLRCLPCINLGNKAGILSGVVQCDCLPCFNHCASEPRRADRHLPQAISLVIIFDQCARDSHKDSNCVGAEESFGAPRQYVCKLAPVLGTKHIFFVVSTNLWLRAQHDFRTKTDRAWSQRLLENRGCGSLGARFHGQNITVTHLWGNRFVRVAASHLTLVQIGQNREQRNAEAVHGSASVHVAQRVTRLHKHGELPLRKCWDQARKPDSSHVKSHASRRPGLSCLGPCRSRPLAKIARESSSPPSLLEGYDNAFVQR